ncbi:MAG: ribosome small subunit-dependent GTPase A, partial [Clostridia bacterium]|nr:ribosome small subunit-dependent GTPase A [Clostridia bacterium]
MEGLVTRSLGGFYNVTSGGVVYESKPRGLFRKEKTVITVGDRVTFTPQENDLAVIEHLHPRRNIFVRPPISNLDRLFIVIAAADPAPDLFFADKLTVIAHHAQVSPIIVINKSDLADASAVAAIYRQAGFPVILANGHTGEGTKEILAMAQDGISALAGFSGVGKSSLLSHLLPHKLETGEVSHKLGRGRHTTRHVELFAVGNGFFADTPGFSSLELTEQSTLRLPDLAAAFPE